jgi:hypothetical protein
VNRFGERACSIASSCHSECTTHQKSCSTISGSSSGGQKTFEQQDRGADTGGTQLQGFFYASNGKTVSFAFKGLGAANGPWP